MAKIHDIISHAGRKSSGIYNSHDKDGPAWVQQEGDFHVGEGDDAQAVNYWTRTIPGAYTTRSIDPAQGGTPTTDTDKYLADLYKKYGDEVTTRELIDKKYIDEAGGELYDKVTGGKNLGIKGDDKVEHRIGGLLDNFSNTTDGGGGTTKTTTTTTPGDPGDQDYNMGYYASLNASMAQAAQRRGARRAARRGTRDVWQNMTKNERKAAKAERKRLRGLGELKKGRLNRRMQMINNTVDRDGDGNMDYDLRNPNVDAARIRAGEDVDLSGKSRQYQDLVGSLSMNKYGGALNKFGKLYGGTPGETTTVTETTDGGGDGNTGGGTTSGTRLRKPGEGSTMLTVGEGWEGGDTLGLPTNTGGGDDTGGKNIFSNIKLNPDDYKIQGDFSTEGLVSRALQSGALGVKPDVDAGKRNVSDQELDEIDLKGTAINRNENPNKQAYKPKTSGILRKSHRRGVGY